MGTDKRQRQKEGRQARIAAAQEAQRRSDRRRRYVTFAIVGVLVLGGFALINAFANNHKSKSVSAEGSSTTTSAATSTTMASAKGKPCVAMKGTPPKGAPTVPVETGTPPTKLVVKDLKTGTGAVVKSTDTVKVNYIGVACSSGAIFDSSWSRGVPASFPLNGVIPGWTQGLAGMRVGGSRLLGIPAALAYGAQGQPPTIAPDETLWFVVDMLGTTPATTTTTAAGSGASTTSTTAASP
jgi:peptidylprolyl isomerase